MSKNLNVKFKLGTGIFWGIVLIGAAVLLILNGIGVNLGYGLSVWRIILGTLCLAWIVTTIVELRFTDLPFPFAFLFIIFEPTIAHALGREDNKLISTWIVLLAALLLTIGLKAIFSGKVKKGVSSVGSKTLYFDGSDLVTAEIRDNAGSVQAYVTNKESYPGDGTIVICDNLGKITLHIPSDWNVTVNSHDNLGKVSVADQEDGVFDKSITVDVRDNVGSVNIVFD
ncbi:MAG: hypothetical protein IJS45_00190 [Clostridia bacterium]|nr:hypothetical protein [Clostridia bacterium]